MNLQKILLKCLGINNKLKQFFIYSMTVYTIVILYFDLLRDVGSVIGETSTIVCQKLLNKTFIESDVREAFVLLGSKPDEALAVYKANLQAIVGFCAEQIRCVFVLLPPFASNFEQHWTASKQAIKDVVQPFIDKQQVKCVKLMITHGERSIEEISRLDFTFNAENVSADGILTQKGALRYMHWLESVYNIEGWFKMQLPKGKINCAHKFNWFFFEEISHELTDYYAQWQHLPKTVALKKWIDRTGLPMTPAVHTQIERTVFSDMWSEAGLPQQVFSYLTIWIRSNELY